ncbi:hypothetical protein P170DRAFT_421947 [Aspergillus steynii IBT 23096]|uniref:WIBG Mago-binding domain-containing protein n=1 Tax=Aspergillus steynii IBT 23096 TaxID=1392250 RepID=A0A2I2GR76_9EURO|nr:uncharacterized protein P170DRAFT_421947 [Aspergillus steynii IBT 23096]PLB55385.1 hypothetical protein P170DRAFT_421947 [Aspergillus steynii IBT 23096]
MASTNSGITTDAATGERYIPSSLRADGSKRREIRVRPGYRPPEDVELYKNRAAEAWKNRGKAGVVPGAEALNTDDATSKAASASTNKNAKRREAKKKAKANQDGPGSTDTKTGKDSDNWRVPAEKASSNGPEKPTEDPVDAEAEKEKKARNLKKKLRQARDLRDKKNQGEDLLPEQFDKVIKIQELIRQLDGLGFDSNGDKKQDGTANEKA